MNKLKFINYSSNKVKETLSRVYGLSSSEYVITDLGSVCDVDINCPDKIIDSKIVVTCDQSVFNGFLNCYPPVNNGKIFTLDDIKRYIADEGIVVNIDEEEMQKCFEHYSAGEIIEKVLIAQGTKPVNGKDAEIVIHFGVPETRPKIVDGKIDYKSVENIVMVSKGDLLLTKRPATQGVKGFNIRKEEIAPIPGKDVTILVGDGATVDETGTQFTATLDGYVDYNSKKLAVLPLYVVKGNVDYSTGNIKFNGSVHVKGDVLPGFKVEADKNVLVDGICQDSELIAKENVILRTGIKGSIGGVVKAGGSAIIGYCEKSRIEARLNIEIKKYAFNCELMAGNRIDATSGEGVVAGGSLKAFQEIAVKQLGTQGNCIFNVFVGSKYYIERELENIRKENIRISDTLLHVEMALMRFDLSNEKVKTHPKIQKTLEIKQGLDNLMKDLATKESKLRAENIARNPRVKVKGRVFEGITIHVFESNTIVKEILENVAFHYDQTLNEIVTVSLKNLDNIELHD